MFGILCMLSAPSCGYQSYTIDKPSYGEPGQYTQKEMVSALKSLDLKIASANSEVVETQPILKYIGNDWQAIEFQVWFRAYLREGRYRVYCLERKMYTGRNSFNRQSNWRFHECTHPWILREIHDILDSIDYALTTQNQGR